MKGYTRKPSQRYTFSYFRRLYRYALKVARLVGNAEWMEYVG